MMCSESTIDSEGFKGGTRGAPIMPRDAVSRTAHVGTVGTNGLIKAYISSRFDIKLGDLLAWESV